MGQLMVKAVNNYDQTSVFSILSRAAIFSLTLSWIESISLYTSCKKMHIITNINMQSFRENKNWFYAYTQWWTCRTIVVFHQLTCSLK